MHPIRHYTLSGLLPEGWRLALDPERRLITLLSPMREQALYAQELLASSEVRLLSPILDAYPHHCPLDVLFASLFRGNTQAATVARARAYLTQMVETAAWDEATRPLRSAKARLDPKLRQVGLCLQSVQQNGYLLMRWPGFFEAAAAMEAPTSPGARETSEHEKGAHA